MPPWPDRADSRPAVGPAVDLTPRVPRPNAPPARFADPMTDFIIPLDTSQIDDSSSSSDGRLHPPRPARPGHGRSMSNPFPSLFSSKKKKPGPSFAEDPYSGSSDEDSGGPNTRPNPHQTRAGRHRPAGSRDFTTGQCMTCGSLVRWPRELVVFRCTICLTINDLQPASPEGRGERIQEAELTRGEASGLPPRPSNRKETPAPSMGDLPRSRSKTLINYFQQLQFLSNKPGP
jgi:E3 ubiquitin-protein ligase HECTD2